MYPHWSIIPKQQIFYLRTTNMKQRIFSPKYSFSFLSSLLCTPTDKNVVQTKINEKCFSLKLVFLNKKFFSTILCNPFGKLSRTFQKSFFSEINFYDEKKSEERFLHLTVPLYSPTNKNAIQNNFLTKLFLKKFNSQVYIFFPSSCVCTPIDSSYQIIQNFFKKVFLWKTLF